jgi:hypothetical protein
MAHNQSMLWNVHTVPEESAAGRRVCVLFSDGTFVTGELEMTREIEGAVVSIEPRLIVRDQQGAERSLEHLVRWRFLGK